MKLIIYLRHKQNIKKILEIFKHKREKLTKKNRKKQTDTVF